MITLDEFKTRYWHKVWHKSLKLKVLTKYKEWMLIEKTFMGHQLVSPQRMLINRITGKIYMWQKRNNNLNYSILGNTWNGWVGYRDFNYDEQNIEYLLDKIMIELL